MKKNVQPKDKDTMTHLKQYMLTNKNLSSFLSFNTNPIIMNTEKRFPNNEKRFPNTEKNEKSVSNLCVKETNFSPREKDSLFWCFYIIKHGIEKYNELGNINVVIEKREKINYVELLRKQKNEVKKYKIASLCYIENALVNESVIDLKTFLVLCIIEKISILYIHKKTCFHFEQDDGDDGVFIGDDSTNSVPQKNEEGFILKRGESRNRFSCEVDVSKERIVEYKSSYYQVESIDKPYKAYTSYKTADLVELCNKLEIPLVDNKKKTKKEMYESVVQYFS